ncbi:MAG: trypsin-like peptidase domain-containing protein [Candidatus Brocadiia bacterium]
MHRAVALAVPVAALLAVPQAAGQEVPRRNAIVEAVERTAPGVVNISTERIVTRRGDPFFEFRDPFFDDFFREYFDRFGGPRRYRTSSLGSGVVIDPDGYVVTNEHVVRKASEIRLTLADGTRHEGKLLSTDPDSDLALIKVDADQPLPTVPMGRSDDLMIGETVIALGNPFGLESTVTTGVVSATNRSVMLRGQEAYAGLIQTDAAINPGNSGGALVNIRGELIGINVAIYAQAQGIGFAIPVDQVREVLAGLFNYRVVNKTYLGIKAQAISPELAEKHGLARRRGVVITAVDEGSPAAQGGLQPGDVVLQVGDHEVHDSLTFLKRMLAFEAGERVALTVLRGEQRRRVEVAVAKVPRPSGQQLARQKLGLGLQAMTAELARAFGLRRPVGLLVSEVEEGGPGDQAGLRRGDVVLRFGPFAINSLERLAILLEQTEPGRFSLVIVRGGRLYRTTIATR